MHDSLSISFLNVSKNACYYHIALYVTGFHYLLVVRLANILFLISLPISQTSFSKQQLHAIAAAKLQMVSFALSYMVFQFY